MESSAPNLRPQPRRGGVRVVGRVRPFLDSEIAGGSNHPDFTVSRLEGDHAVVDFGDRTSGGNRRDRYKLDWCYEQQEGVGDVFNGEVKPFLEGLFRGCNACVIAYGARGSGKSQLIQGSDEIPGLAFISVSEILSLANELGGSVAMSCYEVSQDHIYDLLEPKEQEVFVLEDAARRIQLKGLSQVPINSIADFKKLYYNKGNQKMPLQKTVNDSLIGNHQGLVISVSCIDKESNKSFVGKINFIDLTGFEANKQKINSKAHAIECNKINKSLYALLNVVNALNANESFIPYRESKLTRLLQDCLCRASSAVFITCLSPIPCQDTIHAINLASRSSQVINQYRMDSAKSIKTGSRFIPSRSPSTGGLRTLETSLKKFEPSKFASTETKGNGTPSTTKTKTKPRFSFAKKQGVTKLGTIEKITDNSSAVANGRKLFDGTSPAVKNMKTNIMPSELAEVVTVDKNNTEIGSINAECSNLEEENHIYVHPNAQGSIAKLDDCDMKEFTKVQDNGLTPEINEKTPADQCDMIKDEIYSSVNNEDMQSPPISEKLKEISNALKLLSTQSCVGTPKVDTSCTKQLNREVLDPMTPGVPFEMRLDGGSHVEYMCTPQDLFKTRSTGLKKSLLQECLSFLNTANKEELKRLKGIGEKRANFIVDIRENSPEPFKDINDLKRLGLTSRQINTMISGILGEF